MALWNVIPFCVATFSLLASDIIGSNINRPMPDLSKLVLYTDQQVHNSGKLIKGLYYNGIGQSEHMALAFHNACDLVLKSGRSLL